MKKKIRRQKVNNVIYKYEALTHVFKTSSPLYLRFAREGGKILYIISDISTGNVTLCREEHDARELQVERVWSRFFRDFKIRFKPDVASPSCQCARSFWRYSSLGQMRRRTLTSDLSSGFHHQHFADGEPNSSAISL